MPKIDELNLNKLRHALHDGLCNLTAVLDFEAEVNDESLHGSLSGLTELALAVVAIDYTRRSNRNRKPKA